MCVTGTPITIFAQAHRVLRGSAHAFKATGFVAYILQNTTNKATNKPVQISHFCDNVYNIKISPSAIAFPLFDPKYTATRTGDKQP